MSAKKLIPRLRYYFQFFPVTVQGLIILGVFFLSYYLMFSESDTEHPEVDSFAAILLLLGKTVLWFLLFFVTYGFVSVCFTWLIYLIRKRRNKGLTFDFQTNNQSGGVLLLPDRKIPVPLLGSVKLRLVYDDIALTPRFLWKGAGGKKKRDSRHFLAFDEIKTYRLKGSFLFFEDLFRIFSFPLFQSQEADFFRGPRNRNLQEMQTDPRVADTPDIKTRYLRRIPGDFLNYKNFESGDDIRRIVWKLYAKNRELIVRTAEEKDRYASRVYLYASFHVSLSGMQNVFAREMLNFYKNTIWTVYDSLVKQKMPVTFEADQPFVSGKSGADESVSMIISNCTWQQNYLLADYFNKRKGSILLVTSFNDYAALSRLLTESPGDVKILFVKLSAVFEHPFFSTWLGRIFLRPEEDRLKRIRGRWIFSPLRMPLMRNEKKIIKLLEDSGKDTAVL